MCAEPEKQLDLLQAFIRQSFDTYPRAWQKAFSVVWATRHGTGMKSMFFVGEVSWSPGTGWSRTVHPMPATSDVVVNIGSGSRRFMEVYKRWKASDAGGTSRAVYSAFCDHINSREDDGTGGPPQLVGLYRKDLAFTLGSVFMKSLWLSGAAVPKGCDYKHLEWRDELFQRCDPVSLHPLGGAQRHARPRNV